MRKLEQFRTVPFYIQIPYVVVIDNFYSVQPLMSVICLGLYWDIPLVCLSPGFLIPFERFLAIPGFSVGAISAVGWLSVCRRVSMKLFGT